MSNDTQKNGLPQENPGSDAPAIVPAEKQNTAKKRSTRRVKGESKNLSAHQAPVVQTEETPPVAGQEVDRKAYEPPMSLSAATELLGSRKEALNQNRDKAKVRAEFQREREANFVAFAKIRDALENKSIVTGTIVGVEEKVSEMFAVTLFEGVRTLIPYSQLYCDNALVKDEDEDIANYLRRQRQVITKSLGARIRFLIKAMYNGDGYSTDTVLLASRKEAMLRDQKRYYTSPEGKTPYVQIGGQYEGTIIGVGTYGVRIYVCGVDTQLWTFALSYRCIDDVPSEFFPGQTLDVVVTEIGNKEDGEGLAIKASAKLAELPTYIKNAANVIPGSLCMARIVRLHIKKETNEPIADLFLEEFNIPAYAKIFKTDGLVRSPRQGDLVAFRVDKVHSNGIATGAVTRLICDREAYIQMKKT